MQSYGVLFPGQGSQFVGMGAELFAARPNLLGANADRVLGWSLEQTCRVGPESTLTRTERAQPALYALSYTLWDELARRLPEPPVAAAGHSLGEYTALAASGVIDYLAGLAVVHTRAVAMAEAARRQPSGMVAVLGITEAQAEAIAARRRAEGGQLWLANLNGAGQVVFSGARADVSWLLESAEDLGARRAIQLKVAGGFHAPPMEAALPSLRAALEGVSFGPSQFPVFSNVDATPIQPGHEAGALARQLLSPVRFADCLMAMVAAGVELFVHIGPGEVTAGLARRAIPTARTLTVSNLSDIPMAVAAIMGTKGESE